MSVPFVPQWLGTVLGVTGPDVTGNRSGGRLRAWLAPNRPETPERVADPGRRRAILFEVLLVFTLTLGISAAQSLLSLIDAMVRPEPLGEQQVAINAPGARVGALDLLHQLLNALRLFAWGALGVYLLWRAGLGPRHFGMDGRHRGRDIAGGFGLAALIGIPGLGLYLLAHTLGFALTVQPSTLDDAWWRAPVLILSAFGNSFAEETLVVAYLLMRLRQLGWSENAALWVSALLRGTYHLYQGVGGFVGNIVMGLIYGRLWQRTNRLVPLIIGHALIDVVAFAGYALLSPHLDWLP